MKHSDGGTIARSGMGNLDPYLQLSPFICTIRDCHLMILNHE